MQGAAQALDEFGVPYEVRVLSAHRTPRDMLDWSREADRRGAARRHRRRGGAAHLPGMVASMTPLPVIGVPVPLKHLDGMDSLLSIVQMPAGRAGRDREHRRRAQRRAARGAHPRASDPSCSSDALQQRSRLKRRAKTTRCRSSCIDGCSLCVAVVLAASRAASRGADSLAVGRATLL
jgi:5-(carboxyamino)imidazole ribonucleotide mutase